MSDTVELIIEIPKEAKQALDNAYSNDLRGGYYDCGGVIGKAIQNGTPLDDVKAEIEQKAYLDGFEGCAESVEKYLSDKDKERLECLLSALRNSVSIDWGEESEADFPQAKDIEPTVKNFSKVLDNNLISDAIRDCGADMKGNNMTREEAIAILDGFKHNPLFNEQHFEALEMAISALSENKTQMIDKSNFDVEQYKADLQCAYDCGYNKALSENKCFDGMTNGEAIQALFDGLVIHDNPAKQKYTIPMTYEFWNAPYQKGGE